MANQRFSHKKGHMIPARAGVGLRHPHIQEFVDTSPFIAWLEVHNENFMADDSPRQRALDKLREDYPLSCHGVGLSLGSAGPLSEEHLQKLKKLIKRYQPGLVSEHVAWSVTDGTYLNDLLPIPYTHEALQIFCEHIQQTQDVLGRQILIENPSSYVAFEAKDWTEWGFIKEALKRTGCGLLLDINNVYVSAANHKFDALEYISTFKSEDVQEIHLAGHLQMPLIDDEVLLLDSHSRKVANDVWSLYEQTVARIGAKPTLIEWDNDIPKLAVLLAEAYKADKILDKIINGVMNVG